MLPPIQCRFQSEKSNDPTDIRSSDQPPRSRMIRLRWPLIRRTERPYEPIQPIIFFNVLVRSNIIIFSSCDQNENLTSCLTEKTPLEEIALQNLEFRKILRRLIETFRPPKMFKSLSQIKTLNRRRNRSPKSSLG